MNAPAGCTGRDVPAPGWALHRLIDAGPSPSADHPFGAKPHRGARPWGGAGAARLRRAQRTGWRTATALLALASLAACSAARPGPDALELATISRWAEVPKSSPAGLVATFDRHCVHRPQGAAAQDAALRDAGYVPKIRPGARRAGVYVADDWRPAVISDARICGVRAIARTGQTNLVNRYVAASFPRATALDPAAFGNDVEQAWRVEGGMIATMRNDWAGNRSAYTVTLFRP